MPIPYTDFAGHGPTLHFSHPNAYTPGSFRPFLAPLTAHFHVLAAHHRPLWYLSPGYSDEWHETFLATGLSEVPTEFDGVEERHMDLVRLDLTDAVEAVASGGIVDAKTIIALLAAERRGAGARSAGLGGRSPSPARVSGPTIPRSRPSWAGFGWNGAGRRRPCRPTAVTSWPTWRGWNGHS